MEVMGTSSIIPVTAEDSSQVGQARRAAVSLAAQIGFGELRLGELSIVVTEAARNIASHAGEGHIVLSPWVVDGRAAIDVFAIDRGKGISEKMVIPPPVPPARDWAPSPESPAPSISIPPAPARFSSPVCIAILPNSPMSPKLKP
jgi:hypothetical protein